MSFLMVGHTNDDVDAIFFKVAVQVQGKRLARTLLAMMTKVWECEEIHLVSRLINDYKPHYKLDTFNQ